MALKSILKPENSVIAGLAVMGAVFANYQLNIGTVAQASATVANYPVLESARKKAGYSSLILVAGLSLITKDANIAILGGATIITMELAYRHGIMANPQSLHMENPNPQAAYEPAENVVPFNYQGQTG
jgi:hypothetical protein